MPVKSLRPCAHPGCTTLVGGGRCKSHTNDSQYRDREVKRMYNSKQWRARRERQLAEYPWCASHLERKEYVPATDVDHVTPHRGDASQFFSGTLQSLCRACHSAKTASEVWQSPPSKKV